MDDLTKKHLQDILTAIEEIESFFGSEPNYMMIFTVIFALDVR